MINARVKAILKLTKRATLHTCASIQPPVLVHTTLESPSLFSLSLFLSLSLSLSLCFSLSLSFSFAYLQVHDASTFSAHHCSPYSRLSAKSLIVLYQGTMGLYPSPTARWFRSGQKLSASRATSLVVITMVFLALSPFRWMFLRVRKHMQNGTLHVLACGHVATPPRTSLSTRAKTTRFGRHARSARKDETMDL